MELFSLNWYPEKMHFVDAGEIEMIKNFLLLNTMTPHELNNLRDMVSMLSDVLVEDRTNLYQISRDIDRASAIVSVIDAAKSEKEVL